MPNLRLAGDSDSILNGNTQGNVRAQLGALVDLMRQVAGDAAISAGALEQADPLNAPFTLYVNPYTGSDKFVGGAYNTYEAGATDEEIIASKLKRLEKQRLTCGFTPQRPFKTINRAIIEAAIITSKDWYTYSDPRAHVDCVSIVLAPGVHTLYNDPGSSSTSLTSWGDEKTPTTADLIAFNPATVGGVLLPRGCSLCGPDLRKTTIRPNWVPATEDEAADYSNRRGMLKITGTGYFFGFTVMDKVGEARSHHLLDAFHFASKTELDAFYAKCRSSVGAGADLSNTLTVSRRTEYEIVGPIDTTQPAASTWDTTASASPYIFNCSIRSDYGLGGAFMDGAKVTGLKSMVCANFTGVSLQKDMSCWQRYVNSTWTSTTYAEYIEADPDNIRMNPARMSRHISAINNAFIQEVSVFAIGHGIHHFTDSGGEITVTNSNSSFGGCAAFSRGYKSFAFPQDKNWNLSRIRVPLNLGEKRGNVRQIDLGRIAAISSTKITLEVPLAADETNTTTPAILLQDGYSLRSGTRIWVENPTGDHWRATLTSAAWDASDPTVINITGQLLQAESNQPVGNQELEDEEGNPVVGPSLAIGKRVYIRRLVDTRSPSERRLTLRLTNTANVPASVRSPERNFILQTPVAPSIGRNLDPSSEVFIVTSTGLDPVIDPNSANAAEITIRRGGASVEYANGVFYRIGTVVKYAGKHYRALKDIKTSTAQPDYKAWSETFVHTASNYNPEDALTNESLILVLDTDTSDAFPTVDCGINFSTAWTDANSTVREQYRTSTDYLGVFAFLRALGFSDNAAEAALVPRTAATRDRNPSSATDFPTLPSGGAATGRGNWPIEFRRPSVLRLYGHAWEWAGYLNYSKSIPAAQKDLSPQNKFTYYFTNEAGGRVVPQGSNEDGFNVTPRGLEDVETGTTLSVNAVGNSTVDQAQRTRFDRLTATEITTESLIVSREIEFPPSAAAQTDRLGIAKLAGIAALGNTQPLIPSTDAGINKAQPEVVTVEGLNYWRRAQGIVTRRTTTTTLYVVPDNAVQGGSYRFDSNIFNNTVTLATNPNRSGNDLAENPPFSAGTATTFATAVAYANANFSETERVRYLLANGPYYTQVLEFNHIADIVGATNKFPAANSVADYTQPNTKPTTDVKAIHDATEPFQAPCFACTISATFVPFPNLVFEANPLQLRFNYSATVSGICWLSLGRTLADTANFPASIYQASLRPYRTANVSLQAFMDGYLNADAPSDSFLAKFWGNTNIVTKGPNLEVRDCIFGAKAPGRGFIGYGDRGATIRAIGDADLLLRGIYLLGNTILSSLPLAVAKGITIATTETYGIRNTQDFIGGRTGGGKGVKLSISFAWRYQAEPSGNDWAKDYDVNCIHVLDNNGNYGLLANRAATDGTRGASMEAFIGEMDSGTSVTTGGFESWGTGFTRSGRHHGIAGCFGNNSSTGTGPYGMSTSVSPIQFFRLSSRHNSLWQLAKSSTRLTTDKTLTPAPGTTELSYTASSSNPLNLNVQAFYKGIDISNAQVVGGALEEDRFYG